MANKIKKQTAELISIAELARRAGVSRAAASQWCKSQEEQGIKLTQPSERNGKLLDANNPLVKQYIENTLNKSRRAFEDKIVKSENTLRKIRYQTEKLRLQNTALREKYIDTEAAVKCLDKTLEIEKEVFNGFSDRILDKIEKDFKLTIAPYKRKQAKTLLDQGIQDAYIMHLRVVDDFKKSIKYAPKKAAV